MLITSAFLIDHWVAVNDAFHEALIIYVKMSNL